MLVLTRLSRLGRIECIYQCCQNCWRMSSTRRREARVKEELERLDRFESVFVEPDVEAELEDEDEPEIDSELLPLALLASFPEDWLEDDGCLLLLFSGKLEIVFPSP